MTEAKLQAESFRRRNRARLRVRETLRSQLTEIRAVARLMEAIGQVPKNGTEHQQFETGAVNSTLCWWQ